MAQQGAPATFTGPIELWIPQLQFGPGAAEQDTPPDDDPFAGMDDAGVPAVTEVTIQETLDAGAVAAEVELPPALALHRLEQPMTLEAPLAMAAISPALLGAQGPQQVVVHLSEPSLAESAAAEVSISARDNQRAQLGRVRSQQVRAEQAIRALAGDVQVLGAMQSAMNAVIVEVDATSLPAVAAHPDVLLLYRDGAPEGQEAGVVIVAP